jgi:hypothetical protein
MYSIILKNDVTGKEETFASADYKDNILSLSFTIPSPKQPWWYRYREFFTPALLLLMLIKRS